MKTYHGIIQPSTVNCGSGECGDTHVFWLLDESDSWEVTWTTDEPPISRMLEVQAEAVDDEMVIHAWKRSGHAARPEVQDVTIGYAVRVSAEDRNNTPEGRERAERQAKEHARDIQAYFRAVMPPWCRVDVRGAVIESDEPTRHPIYFRQSHRQAADEGLWDRHQDEGWKPRYHGVYGGPKFQGASGHASGKHFSVYLGASTEYIFPHEAGHCIQLDGTGMVMHTKMFKNGEIVEYSNMRTADWMGVRMRRPNALTLREMGMLWHGCIKKVTESCEVILAPAESLPTAIPFGAHQAIELPNGVWVASRTSFGIYPSSVPAFGVETLLLHRTSNGGQHRITLETVAQGESFEYDGWTIKPLDHRDGLVKVQVSNSASIVPATWPKETLQSWGAVPTSNQISGCWFDPRYPRQGLCLFYVPERVIDGKIVQESIHGCWYTFTQDREGKGKQVFYSIEGPIIDGVARLDIYQSVAGELVYAGRAVFSLDGQILYDFQFVLNNRRGQMKLRKFANALPGSGYYFNPDYKHEGVMLFVTKKSRQAFRFTPSGWHMYDMPLDGPGTVYAPKESGFLSTYDQGLIDLGSCEVQVEDGRLWLVSGDEVRGYPNALVAVR